MMSHTPRRHAARALLYFSLAIATLASGACRKKHRYQPGSARSVLGVRMGTLRSAITQRLDSADKPDWVDKARWEKVRAVYKTFGDAPLWLEPDGVKDRATALLSAIEHAPDHALDVTGYPLEPLKRVVSAIDNGQKASPEALANIDVLLTSAYVAYAADMLVGQVDPHGISQAWHIAMMPKELDSALVRALQSESMKAAIDSMAPQDQEYPTLVREYARYKKIAAAGGWPLVPANGGPALAERLRIEGFTGQTTSDSGGVAAGTPTSDSATKPDSEQVGRKQQGGKAGGAPSLVASLKEFQEHHGLDETGRLDKPTLNALNVPAAYRVQQLAANLERHRWLPRTLGGRYIYVNVPSYRLQAFDSGQKSLEMNVVVGAEYQNRATPVFADSMEMVVFRPYWDVPDGIAEKELFPKGGDYLASHGFEVGSQGGRPHIRQGPGPSNALGLVKFLFPNDFNIYLHDTPAKSLFEKADRAASHGCIRVHHPDQLAAYVLGWPIDKVHEAMNSGPDNRTIRLPTKIPVYIVYFTAYDRDGHLHFGDDIYDRDDQLVRKLGAVPTDSAPPLTATKTN